VIAGSVWLLSSEENTKGDKSTEAKAKQAPAVSPSAPLVRQGESDNTSGDNADSLSSSVQNPGGGRMDNPPVTPSNTIGGGSGTHAASQGNTLGGAVTPPPDPPTGGNSGGGGASPASGLSAATPGGSPVVLPPRDKPKKEESPPPTDKTKRENPLEQKANHELKAALDAQKRAVKRFDDQRQDPRGRSYQNGEDRLTEGQNLLSEKDFDGAQSKLRESTQEFNNAKPSKAREIDSVLDRLN
jgi:hypothetical protein